MGTCPEHGKQTQSVEKLIAKSIVDNGEKAVYARIADEKLEDALKISRNDLKEFLVQSLDPNAPKQLIENRLLGKHVILKGFEGRKAFFVDEIQFLTSAELEERTRQLLKTAAKIKNFTPENLALQGGERSAERPPLTPPGGGKNEVSRNKSLRKRA
jgi:hypothetical protein